MNTRTSRPTNSTPNHCLTDELRATRNDPAGSVPPGTTPTPATEVSALELEGWLASNRAVLFDVRQPSEYDREHIPGARLLQTAGFDADLNERRRGKRIVLLCQTGVRSAESAAALATAGVPDVFSLRGGLRAWRRAGFRTRRDGTQPVDVLRQVQVTIGAMILIFAGLSAFVTPWFLLGLAFIGAGLLNAGWSGTCLLANLLRALPGNRTTGSTTCCVPAVRPEPAEPEPTEPRQSEPRL